MNLPKQVCNHGWRPLRVHIRTAVAGSFFCERKTAWIGCLRIERIKGGIIQDNDLRIRGAESGSGVPFENLHDGGGGGTVRMPVLTILRHFRSSWGKPRQASGLSTCYDFYSWGSQIDSLPRHRLSWLRCRYFPQSLKDKAGLFYTCMKTDKCTFINTRGI